MMVETTFVSCLLDKIAYDKRELSDFELFNFKRSDIKF